jgi:UDP-N-acetylglucosamine--N-acetylmuramyl-(pentapeptide) pyrophosphoryl-undecaprenol N-acetylglucosamine transferase
VIAGGGTGGHVVPSLQIARALVAQGSSPQQIELYGSRRGQEATVWPPLEFPFTLLPGRGIRRSLKPDALWANAGAALGLAWACLRALASFSRRRPRVVVVVGGYAGFPAGVAAVLTRTPLVLVNTDAVPGAVNALLGRFAAANAVAFPGTGLPRAYVTGTPVRPELGHLDRSAPGQRTARLELGLPEDRQTVAAVGGSLGALRINRAVSELAHSWPAGQGRSLYHVTGRRDYEQFALRGEGAAGAAGAASEAGDDSEGSGVSEASEASGLFYRVVPFEDRLPVVFGAADVCVSRAGAMTVAELLVAGLPAILVPLPGAPRDHQTRNAQALVKAGAAVMIPDAECSRERLDAELTALLADDARLRSMAEAARSLAHPDAAARVAELVDANAR